MQEARGALAQHHHRLPGRDAHAALSVAHRGERFDDRRLLQRQPLGQDVDVLRRQLDVLAERAFDLASEEPRHAAKVARPAQAGVAAPAGDDGVDDDVLPRLHCRYALAQRIDHPGRFVAHHHRIFDSRVLSHIDRQVGMAHRRRGGAHHDLAGPGDGLRAIDEIELPRRMKDCRSHSVPAHRAFRMRRIRINGRREWSNPASDRPR